MPDLLTSIINVCNNYQITGDLVEWNISIRFIKKIMFQKQCKTRQIFVVRSLKFFIHWQHIPRWLINRHSPIPITQSSFIPTIHLNLGLPYSRWAPKNCSFGNFNFHPHRTSFYQFWSCFKNLYSLTPFFLKKQPNKN